ncbi:MAG: flotillin domain-containing protein, partial [Alphaproteobacteria bacterium]
AAQRAMHDAYKTLSRVLIDMKVKLAVIEKLQEIIRESVKPLERIEGIKIVQLDGLTRPGDSDRGGVGSASPNLADQVVNSALRYRSHAPVIDALLKEVGLSPRDASDLSSTLADQLGGRGAETPRE